MTEAAQQVGWVEMMQSSSRYYGFIISQVFECIAHESNLFRYYVLGKGTSVMDANDKLSPFF